MKGKKPPTLPPPGCGALTLRPSPQMSDSKRVVSSKMGNGEKVRCLSALIRHFGLRREQKHPSTQEVQQDHGYHSQEGILSA